MLKNLAKLARPLTRKKLPAALVVGVLALGLGTTIAVFAVAEAVLVRDLPVADADGLLYIPSKRLETGGLFGVRLHQALAWREAPSVESLAIMQRGALRFQENAGRRTERLGSAAVSADYFATLGVHPQVGRAFHEDDEDVALISHALWQGRFGGVDSVLGRTIQLDGVPHEVIGVMPPSQELSVLGWRDIWTPLVVDEAEAASRQMWGFSVLARLRDGATTEAARGDLETISSRLAAERPEWYEGWGAEPRTVRDFMASDLEEPLTLVQAAALLVLLIACLTAGNLLFAMTAARRQEMAVRRALGARSVRLLRQLLGESAVITAAAAGLGLLLAVAAGRAMLAGLPPDLLDLERFTIGPRAFALAAAAGLLTVLICGGLSALAVRRAGTHRSVRREGREGDRLRAGLVAAETALATVAIAGTLLLLISLRNVAAVAPGFDAEGLLTLRLEVPASAHADKETRRVAFEELLGEVEALPGVDSAALAGFNLPLTGGAAVFQIWVEGQPRAAQPDQIVHAQVISPTFFDTLGIEQTGGRRFEVGETWDTHHGVIVNRTFAERYFPAGDALGRWVEFGNGERGTIVGTAADTRQLGLDREAQPEIFLAWGTTPTTQALLVRTSGEPSSVAESVRRRVAETLPGTPVFDARTGEEIVRSSYQTRAVTTWALTAFAALALVLGLVGLYGLVLQQVTGRRRDLGVRVAVGATPGDLVRWAALRGLKPVVLGLLVGIAGGVAATRGLESQLYGVEASDPGVFALAAVATLLTALVTALVPARGAARVDPATALRAD